MIEYKRAILNYIIQNIIPYYPLPREDVSFYINQKFKENIYKGVLQRLRSKGLRQNLDLLNEDIFYGNYKVMEYIVSTEFKGGIKSKDNNKRWELKYELILPKATANFKRYINFIREDSYDKRGLSQRILKGYLQTQPEIFQGIKGRSIIDKDNESYIFHKKRGFKIKPNFPIHYRQYLLNNVRNIILSQFLKKENKILKALEFKINNKIFKPQKIKVKIINKVLEYIKNFGKKAENILVDINFRNLSRRLKTKQKEIT
jgi:hypothetical protein